MPALMAESSRRFEDFYDQTAEVKWKRIAPCVAANDGGLSQGGTLDRRLRGFVDKMPLAQSLTKA